VTQRRAASIPTEAAPSPPPVVEPPRGDAAAPRSPGKASRANQPATLAAEQALLDEAQRALAGDAPAAIAILERHAARFPRGLLAEEREAMTVRALVATGRRDEARRRAAAFVATWPSSLFRGSVEAALSSSP
jgi:ATP-dependent helicase YprA (DUF1998 family)